MGRLLSVTGSLQVFTGRYVHMIDFHTHILPAMDDGAVTVDESIAMAKCLHAFGYKAVCCTPHCIKGFYDLTPDKVREATLMLQADLDNEDIALELWPGMEYILDETFAGYADNLLPLGDTKLVLCEAPPEADPGYVHDGLELILDKGFVPLIAHPERTPYFYEMLCSRNEEQATRDEKTKRENNQKEFMDEFSASRVPRPASRNFFKKFLPFLSRPARPVSLSIKAKSSALPEGCLFHANLGSFTGYYGQDVQRMAYELLKLNVYTALASDLHDSRSASQVLVHDKFAMNPYLKKLADFNGTASAVTKANGGSADSGGQGELF